MRTVILFTAALTCCYIVKYVLLQMYKLGRNRKKSHLYADYAGCPPCPPELLQEYFEDISQGIGRYRNPHSSAPFQDEIHSNTHTSHAMIQSLRKATLQHCNASADEYVCIITHGATSACHLVAECFPWGDDGEFHYLLDNHTSVVGIQGGIGTDKGVEENGYAPLSKRVTCVSVEEFKDWYCACGDAQTESIQYNYSTLKPFTSQTSVVKNLFAFPAESNFSGSRYSLDIVKFIQDGKQFSVPSKNSERKRFRVLVDAAKASASFPPNLSVYKPDFVVMSYYKIFGYPTGLGALLVHKNAMDDLQPRYFGGGTVDFLIPEKGIVEFKRDVAKFENGTASFLSVPAAVLGFDWLKKACGDPRSIDLSSIEIARKLASILGKLTHSNGQTVCTIYGHWQNIANRNTRMEVEDFQCIQGPTVTFNVFDRNGLAFGSREIQTAASMNGIQLRSGSLCNAGALRHALGIGADEMATWRSSGYSCDGALSTINGAPAGAVRASFGYQSTMMDAERIGNFIRENFCTANEMNSDIQTETVKLDQIFLYPIKSCQPQSVFSWQLDSNGLKFDRHWKIIDPQSHETMTLKSCPMLCKIKPTIDLLNKTLKISFDSEQDDFVTLPIIPDYDEREGVKSYSQANKWLSEKLKRPSCLICLRPSETAKNFSNQSGVLVMYNTTIQGIQKQSKIKEDFLTFALRMRPNMIFSSVGRTGKAFDDDTWSRLICTASSINIEAQYLRPCKRCEMICIDPINGNFHRNKEPLKAIIKAKKGTARETRFSLGSLFEFKRTPSPIQIGIQFTVK